MNFVGFPSPESGNSQRSFPDAGDGVEKIIRSPSGDQSVGITLFDSI